MSEWRKEPEVWRSPIHFAAAAIEKYYADGRKLGIAESSEIKATVKQVENEILKNTEHVPKQSAFKAGKEGAGNEVAQPRDDGGFRPQPSPSSSDDDVSRPDDATVWATKGTWKTIANSRDVYAIRYEIKTGSLFIQYRENGAGSIYEYGGVSIPEAHSCYRATDVDEWILNHIRVRGKWSEHYKPYRFVINPKGRVPNEAVARYRGRRGEWFVSRTEWNVAVPASDDGPDKGTKPFQKHSGSSRKKGNSRR